MLTQWLKPARGCKLVLLSLVTNLIDCILPFTYCPLPLAYCTLTYCIIDDDDVFFAHVNRSHNCQSFTLMKSMTKVLSVNSTAWSYRSSILDGSTSKLGNVCTVYTTARFLFLAIMFLFSKKCFLFVPFLWLCTCAIVNFLFITFQCRQPGWRLHSGRLHFEATITVWEICASSQNFKRQLGTSTNAKVAFLYLCISYFSFLSHQFPMPRAAQPQKEVDFVFSCYFQNFCQNIKRKITKGSTIMIFALLS